MRTLLLSLPLHLPRAISLLSLAALCPEDAQSQETQSTDLTDTLNTMRENMMQVMEEFLTSRSKIEDLVKVITGNV